MKKRILAIMLVLPLIVAFAAMGFTKLVSIAVPQMPEFINLEYEDNETFEFEGFNETMELRGFVYPESSNQTLIWTSSDERIATIAGNILTFKEEGTVTITASLDNSPMTKSFTASFVLAGTIPKIVKYNYVYPSEKGENVIGLYDYADPLNSEQTVAHTEVIKYAISPSQAPQGIIVRGIPEGEYKVENSQILFTPSKAGKYTVTIHSEADPEIASELNLEVTDSVNIYSYEDIVRATDYNSSSTMALSLRVNLESSSNLVRTNSKPLTYESGAKHHKYYAERSAYDTQYIENYNKYSNGNKTTDVLAVLVFKGDVYGNGHTINLHDHAYPSEIDPSTGLAIPKINSNGEFADDFAAEPLEFVSAGGLTVFGQGNRGFLVKGNGITVDNIVLKNCNNVDNLSNLDYVGTVLEVEGDDVTIKNSTVQNGRTVVRTFSNENLRIENCLLAYAREFIFKQGSNQFAYPDKAAYTEGWSQDIHDQMFDNSRLPAEALAGDSTATIVDTDFYTSGIFSVGMDAHFAGQLLYKFDEQVIHDLAATSYKSTLNLEGDINFYDWKLAKNMDSSTLVKGEYEGIDLNLYELLKAYDEVHNVGIIKNVKGSEYVHGGIAFFGGGNNLSEVYMNGKSVKALNDDQYVSLSVSLTDKIFETTNTKAYILSMAAGTGNFYFCIYRSSYEGIGIDANPFNS